MYEALLDHQNITHLPLKCVWKPQRGLLAATFIKLYTFLSRHSTMLLFLYIICPILSAFDFLSAGLKACVCGTSKGLELTLTLAWIKLRRLGR